VCQLFVVATVDHVQSQVSSQHHLDLGSRFLVRTVAFRFYGAVPVFLVVWAVFHLPRVSRCSSRASYNDVDLPDSARYATGKVMAHIASQRSNEDDHTHYGSDWFTHARE